MHTRAVDTRDGRAHRARARGNQQPVEADHAAVLERHCAGGAVERLCATTAQFDAQRLEVSGGVAQMRAVLADIADQQIGNGHARVRRLGLVSDDDDRVARRELAKGFRGDDAGRSGAQDEVFHVGFL